MSLPAEALYLAAILDLYSGPGWSVSAVVGASGTPSRLQASRGTGRIEMQLQFNGGDPFYSVSRAPSELTELLSEHMIRPVKRP